MRFAFVFALEISGMGIGLVSRRIDFDALGLESIHLLNARLDNRIL